MKRAVGKSIALILTVVFTLGFAGCGTNEKSINTESNAEIESVSESQTQPEAESQVQTKTEEPVESTMKEIAETYLQILRGNEFKIRLYNWQDAWREEKEPRQIAITDVTGDGIPELIYMRVSKDAIQYREIADICIYTYDKNDRNAKRIYYEEAWEVNVAAGFRYCLFQEKDGSFYAYTSFGDDYLINQFSLFSMKEGDKMDCSVQLKKYDHSVDNTNSDRTQDYTGPDGEEITEEEYYRRKTSLAESVEICILQSNLDDRELYNTMEGTGSIAMNYDEAVQYLQEITGESENKIAEAKEIFSDLDELEFCFSSGAGFWATFLLFNEDGTFYGNYHDTDMGGRDEEAYPKGTRYICDFEGRFTALEKTSDYLYRIKLEELSYNKEPGDTWIEDGLLLIAEDAYGLENSVGEEFTLFVPGFPIEAMPIELRRQFNPSYDPEAMYDTLTGYVLYNEKKDHAFGARDASLSEKGFLPESSRRKLTTADIAGMSGDDIQLAINTIYARHGYQFKDSELLQYFSSFDWYQPVESDMEKIKSTFTEMEKQNIEFLAGSL